MGMIINNQDESPNILIYDNEKYYTSGREELFEPYLKKHNIVLFPYSTGVTTIGCIVTRIDRRYTATWMIEDDMLFLVGIQANILPQYILEKMRIPSSECHVGLDFFFPADEKKILADWYSGKLSFLSYEDEQRVEVLAFAIDKGRVTSKELRNYEKCHDYQEYDDSCGSSRSSHTMSGDYLSFDDQDDDALPF